MDYFSADDLDSVAYIEEDSNNVIIKFYGFPNKVAADQKISYAMLNMGFDYQPYSWYEIRHDTLDMDIKIPYTPRKHQAYLHKQIDKNRWNRTRMP
jgi:hypothetical protein